MRRIQITKWIGFGLLVLALLALAPAALAQDGGGDTPTGDTTTVTDDEVNAIAEQLYCPVCENIPLDVCGTQACADWRDEIRTMLENGRSEADIKTYFVERYGQRVLATPERKGLDLFIWFLPPIVVIIGAVVLVQAIRRMAPSKQVEPSIEIDYEGLDPEYVARLERELREFSG